MSQYTYYSYANTKTHVLCTFLGCVLLTSCGLCYVFLQESLALDHASEETKGHDKKMTRKLTVVLLFVILVNGINQEL